MRVTCTKTHNVELDDRRSALFIEGVDYELAGELKDVKSRYLKPVTKEAGDGREQRT